MAIYLVIENVDDADELRKQAVATAVKKNGYFGGCISRELGDSDELLRVWQYNGNGHTYSEEDAADRLADAMYTLDNATINQRSGYLYWKVFIG